MSRNRLFADIANSMYASKQSSSFSEVLPNVDASPPNVDASRLAELEIKYKDCKSKYNKRKQTYKNLLIKLDELEKYTKGLNEQIRLTQREGLVTPSQGDIDADNDYDDDEVKSLIKTDAGGIRKYKKSRKRQKSRKLKKSRKYKKSSK